MSLLKFFRKTHKWVGIGAALILLNVSITGLLLLEKKAFDWIQPTAHEGSAGAAEDFIDLQTLLAVVFAQGHEDFKTVVDIERVDFRPDKRVHRVHSRNHFSEMQIDAITGEVLHVGRRRSDLFENLHDGTFYGSFFGGWVHLLLMPVAAVALLFLTISGLYLWLTPLLNKRARRKTQPSA